MTLYSLSSPEDDTASPRVSSRSRCYYLCSQSPLTSVVNISIWIGQITTRIGRERVKLELDRKTCSFVTLLFTDDSVLLEENEGN